MNVSDPYAAPHGSTRRGRGEMQGFRRSMHRRLQILGVLSEAEADEFIGTWLAGTGRAAELELLAQDDRALRTLIAASRGTEVVHPGGSEILDSPGAVAMNLWRAEEPPESPVEPSDVWAGTASALVRTRPVKEILAWVGDDVGRALAVLEAESVIAEKQERLVRATLVRHYNRVSARAR